MNYENAWKTLKRRVKECGCTNEFPDFKNNTGSIQEFCNWFNWSMEAIERDGQPKQYSWSEILSMNPLPKKIRSCFGAKIPYILKTIYEKEDLKTYVYMNKAYHLEMPSINEMQNKWIVEEKNI